MDNQIAPKSRGEKVIDCVHESLADGTVVHFVGRKYLSSHEQLRRVIWVPVSSTIEKPKTGGRLTKIGSADARQVDAFLRIETYEVHVFAEDAAKIDELFDALLGAVSRTLASTARVGQYSWVSEEQGIAGHSLRQPHIVVRVSFELPVAKKKDKLYVIQAQQHECRLVVPPDEFTDDVS